MVRDMTTAEFKSALRRNGFRFVFGWIDRPDKPGLTVGVRMRKVGGAWKVARRESIAKAIREFAEFDEKGAAH